MSRPSKIERLLGDAWTAHQSGDLGRAESGYRRILRQQPRSAEAANLLGVLYIQERRFDDARTAMKKAVALTPRDPQTQYNAGAAALGAGDPEAAAVFFEESLRLDPGNAATAQALCSAFNDAGVAANAADDTDSAIGWYRRAVDVDPKNAAAQINLGILEEQRGNGEGAELAFQAALRAEPEFADAHFQLAHLKHHASTIDEVEQMRALYDDEQRPAAELAMLAFGIAKALEKLEEYDAEFGWLSKAHERLLPLEPYDHSAMTTHFSRLVSLADQLPDEPAGCEQPRLIFVVGMPRSGTTLCEQVLASHPEVTGIGEQMTGALAFNRLNDSGDTPAIADDLGGSLIQAAGDANVIVETTPGSLPYVGLLSRLFPAARFVVCRRDPRDTCVSIYQHPLSGEHGYAHELETLGAYSNICNDIAAAWKEKLDDRVYELHYEKLAADFETEVRMLLEFCGLSFDEQCLRFHESDRTVRTPSASQVRQPIYTSSIGRWRRYEKHIGPLIRVLESGSDAI